MTRWIAQFPSRRKKCIWPSVFYHRLSCKQVCVALELLAAGYRVEHWAEPWQRDTQPLSPSLTATASQPEASGIHTERPDRESNMWTFSTWGNSANCRAATPPPDVSGSEISGSVQREHKILHDLSRQAVASSVSPPPTLPHRRRRKTRRKKLKGSRSIQTIRTWIKREQEARVTSPKAFPFEDKTLVIGSLLGYPSRARNRFTSTADLM